MWIGGWFLYLTEGLFNDLCRLFQSTHLLPGWSLLFRSEWQKIDRWPRQVDCNRSLLVTISN